MKLKDLLKEAPKKDLEYLYKSKHYIIKNKSSIFLYIQNII